MTVLLALAVNHGALTGPGPSTSGPPAPSESGGAPWPVTVPAPPSSGAAVARGCPAVISHLPAVLDGRQSRPAQSVSPYVAAWGNPPIVLRCGVPRPVAFVQTSSLTVINEVQWLPERRPGAVLWTAVDREVYIEVSVPTAYSSAAVVDLSGALTQALPTRKPQPGQG